MKKIIFGILVLILINGCSAAKYGYTSKDALNQYLLVDQTSNSFGYKRVSYMLGVRGQGFKSFIDEKGLPDYIYEFKEEKRTGVQLFYLSETKVYVFKEETWLLDSMKYLNSREINDQEKSRFGQ